MPWWSGRGLGWKIIIIYSNIGAELELISYRQDGIRPEMSHSSRAAEAITARMFLFPVCCRKQFCIRLCLALVLIRILPISCYLIIPAHTAQWRSFMLQWQIYTNIYSFRTLLFFQDHFFSVLFLHFTLRSRRWEVGKWNWKLVEDTFSFCPSWERMRTLNLIPAQQVTFTWPVATSQPFPWHPAFGPRQWREKVMVLFG